jgi:hypothetical protein
MNVSLLYSVCVVRQRFLRRADPSSRGVLPTVMCVCVWSSENKNNLDTCCEQVGRRSQDYEYTSINDSSGLQKGCTLIPSIETILILSFRGMDKMKGKKIWRAATSGLQVINWPGSPPLPVPTPSSSSANVFFPFLCLFFLFLYVRLSVFLTS